MSRFTTLAALAVAMTYLLVVVGAIVRATDSGLGCPEWPTCHGSWIPPLDDPARGHRVEPPHGGRPDRGRGRGPRPRRGPAPSRPTRARRRQRGRRRPGRLPGLARQGRGRERPVRRDRDRPPRHGDGPVRPPALRLDPQPVSRARSRPAADGAGSPSWPPCRRWPPTASCCSVPTSPPPARRSCSRTGRSWTAACSRSSTPASCPMSSTAGRRSWSVCWWPRWW